MTPRRYTSDSRVEQARLTRRRILEHADQLFRAGGYLGTTLADVARASGVSVQTVYNLVGGKDIVLKAVYDIAVAGDDDPVSMADRPLVRAMVAADSAETALAFYARMAREINERVLSLVIVVLAQAAAGDPQLAEFAATIEHERGLGTAATARQIAARFTLRSGLDRAKAADVLWTLTAPDIADRLVHHRGWSWNRYERWLAQTITDALVGPTGGPRAS
ncbi:TetR/AcrR family transcriptional regulator [uncultured Jatrophihabitans sp.]|uniref:TetR/AcrR family transcriptional regulator n=1 Tax=uncultured Jatrophihabitans sp. TaxID=1610747 RepID=UPI0035CA1A54